MVRMDEKPGNALVIGGTGMLAGATGWLAERSGRTVLVARHASSVAAGDHRFVPLDADWHSPSFERDLTGVVAPLLPLRHALLWLHDPGPALMWLAPLLDQARTVIVLGDMDRPPPLLPCNGALVRLGSKPTDHGRRWLSYREISDAAIAALIDGTSRMVGDLTPANEKGAGQPES